MCVRIAMFHACGYGNACFARVRTYGDVSCVRVRPKISLANVGNDACSGLVITLFN